MWLGWHSLQQRPPARESVQAPGVSCERAPHALPCTRVLERVRGHHKRRGPTGLPCGTLTCCPTSLFAAGPAQHQICALTLATLNAPPPTHSPPVAATPPPPNFCPPPQSLHFPSRSSGFAGGRISVTCALAALAGWSCDKLLSKRRMSGSWERGYHLSLAKAHFLPPYLPTALPLPRISLSSSSSSSSSLSSSLSGVGWGLSKKLASPCPPLSGQLLPARGQRWSMRPSQTRRRSTRRGAPWQGWPNRAK